MSGIRIVKSEEKYYPGLHRSIDEVAREQIYLEMIEGPVWEKFLEHQKSIADHGLPQYLALDGERVVGQADIARLKNPRMIHRGMLGMSIVQGHRGRGIGSRLLEKCLEQAPAAGFEKVELSVYTENLPAIRLYEKFGFVKTGTIKHYRKLDDRYFDIFQMEKFL